MKITLKDESVLEVESGITVLELAKKISEGLARNAMAGEVNGEVKDLRYEIKEDSLRNLKHAFVNPKHAKKGKKLGIAETKKEYILEALENVVTLKEREISITYLNFYELGLVGQNNIQDLRFKLEEHYRIGHASAKTCLKRLNMLGVTLDELKEVLNKL